MASGGLAADGQPGSSERGSALEERKILILYGSETGNSQEAAEDLERMALRLHFETHLFELNEVKPVRPHICVLFACLSASHRGGEQDTCGPIWYGKQYPSTKRRRGVASLLKLFLLVALC